MPSSCRRSAPDSYWQQCQDIRTTSGALSCKQFFHKIINFVDSALAMELSLEIILIVVVLLL
jgi:hypothetical protein